MCNTRAWMKTIKSWGSVLSLYGLVLYVTLFGFAPSGSGITITYQFTGVVTEFHLNVDTLHGDSFSDFGIRSGEQFHGFLSYDLPDESDGRYNLIDYADPWADPFMSLEVRGKTFIVPYSVVATVQDTDSGDSLNFDFGGSGQGIVQSAWETTPHELNTRGPDAFRMTFIDSFGTALSSRDLPQDLDADDWTDNQLWLHGNISWSSFDLYGTITHVQKVPESGDTLPLLAACILGTGIASRVVRARA